MTSVSSASGSMAHIRIPQGTYPFFAATNYPEPMSLWPTALREDERVLSYEVTDQGVIVDLTKGKELKRAFLKELTRQDMVELVRSFRRSRTING